MAMKIHALCLGSHPTTHTSTLDSSFVSCFSLNLAMLTIIYISRRNPFSPWHLSNRVTGSSSPFLHEMCSQTSTVVCFCNTLHLDSLTHSSVHQPSSGMRTLACSRLRMHWTNHPPRVFSVHRSWTLLQDAFSILMTLLFWNKKCSF